MRKFAFLIAACALATTTLAARADTITAATLTVGTSTTNQFTTTTAVIGPGVEFTAVVTGDTYSANFGTLGGIPGVSITDTCSGVCKKFTMTFTDPAFFGATLSSSNGVFGNTLDYSITGDVLTIDVSGRLNGTSGSAAIEIDPAPVPEPGSIALLGTGILGVIGTARRKIFA